MAPAFLPALIRTADLRAPGAAVAAAAPRPAGVAAAAPRSARPAQGPPAGAETYFDDFCDAVVGWPEDSDASLVAGRLLSETGICSYRFVHKRTSIYGATSVQRGAGGEYVAETRVRLDSEDTVVGLLFGMPLEALDGFSALLLAGDGTVGLGRYEGGWRIVDRTAVAGFDLGQPADLAVVVRAATVELWLNGRRVLSAANSVSHDGRIGIYSESTVTGGQAASSEFDYVRLARVAAP